MHDQQLSELFAVASLSLSGFGVLFCCLQPKDRWAFGSLGLVLLASVVIELSGVPWPIANEQTADRVSIVTEVLWVIAMTCVAPLFWNYMRILTSVTPRLPGRLWLHAALPVAACGVAMFVAFMPADARLGLFIDGYEQPEGWPFAVGIAGEVIVLLTVLQWGAYFVAIIRRLLAYRARLHQFVASTARRELVWVWAVVATLALYWIVGAVDVAREVIANRAFIADWMDGLLSLILLTLILLWGLRQRPGLAPEPDIPQAVTKYERSALTPEMSDRIERKLRQAMIEERLHQDPNLSLWSLARHIGASPNYISQTLNEEIGQSFFDFVNGYRIADARDRLAQTDETVLAITYEVGFNSRSSFYTAFKKVTGQTPSQYRAGVSATA